RLEGLPADQAGRSYELRAFVNRRCDAGCFQYDWFDADSDLDGFLDSFERQVTGNALNLYIPRVTDLSLGGEGVFFEFEYFLYLRDDTDFVFEAASALSGPWTDVDGKRIRAAIIRDVEGSETWQLLPGEGQKFFRVRTVPEEER
ncbi:hypothetical protein N9Z79_07915, partial [Akkermansiaceae bacterium]|nr:hypothetical protein [Akkermansiaceae bacterium]